MPDPPRVGFVGAGSVLWAYLQVLDRLVPRGLALEGPICARRRETWPGLLARRPGAQLVETALEVVESDSDVVVVVTPPGSHAELARLALEHGKHVVVEKPLAGTRAEAEPLVAPGRRAWPAPPGRAVRPARPDLSRALDGARRGSDRARPLGPRALRQRRLLLGDVVPRRGRRPARRGRDLQPEEPDRAARPGRRRSIASEATAVRVPRRRRRGRRRARPGRLPRRPAPRERGALLDRLEPGDPALPPPRARALRHRRDSEPARRRLGPDRLRALAQRDRRLGGARGDRPDLALGRRPTRGGRLRP